MQTKTLAIILASAIAASAYPIPFVQPAIYQETISTQYTAADGFADCQGKGLGDFVCWANEDARSYGKMGALELKRAMETPLRLLIKGPAFCCKDDPFHNLAFDHDFLGLIDLEQRISLARKCTPIWWWG